MRALVGHIAAGVIPEVAPGAETHRLQVAVLRGAQEALPIELPWQRRVVERLRHVPVPHRLGERDLAENAAVDDFFRLDDRWRAPALHTDLHDLRALADG